MAWPAFYPAMWGALWCRPCVTMTVGMFWPNCWGGGCAPLRVGGMVFCMALMLEKEPGVDPGCWGGPTPLSPLVMPLPEFRSVAPCA